ncbi:IS200/IS605 family transposase [Sharpea azabuensis]|uniref:IS200/IS605 family transposase n=1 Tax=Sharpea azabuensis TaxID=322505 RepID=UPI003C703302
MVLHIPYRIHTKVLTKRNIWSISKRPKGTLQDKGVEIIKGHLMPDHVHLLLEIPLKLSVSSFMGYLKGKSALMMLDRHANLKYKFGKIFGLKDSMCRQ